jgi:hypothetical protein
MFRNLKKINKKIKELEKKKNNEEENINTGTHCEGHYQYQESKKIEKEIKYLKQERLKFWKW